MPIIEEITMFDYSKLKYETIEDLIKTTKRDENQPYWLTMEAVKRNASLIRYVKDKTPFCKYVLAKNGLLLQFLELKDRTPENCLLAVSQNGLSLQWVHNQTVEICKAAVLQNPAAAKYINAELHLK